MCNGRRIGRRDGTAAPSVLGTLGGRGPVIGRFRVGHAVLLVQPPAEVDLATPRRAERVVRVLLPVPRHRRVTDRTLHLTHRFAPTRTSEILPATRITRPAHFPFFFAPPP